MCSETPTEKCLNILLPHLTRMDYFEICSLKLILKLISRNYELTELKFCMFPIFKNVEYAVLKS